MNLIKILTLLVAAAILTACGGAEERKAAYLEKAEKFMQAGNLDKARIELKNALQIDPKNAEGNFRLGEILEAKEEFTKAFRRYTAAAELAPGETKYHAKLGRYHLLLEDNIEKANEKLELINSIDSDSLYGKLLKAGILVRQEKRAEALKLAESLYKDHPDNIEVVVLLSTLYSNNKEYGKAIAMLESVISKRDFDIQLENALVEMLAFNGQYDEAVRSYRKIIDNDPSVFQSFIRLAYYHNQNDKTDEAMAVLREAIALAPEDVSRRLLLVEFINQIVGKQAAIDELKKDIEIKPDEGQFRLMLAELYKESDQEAKAISTYKDTIDVFGEDGTAVKARIELASIYIENDDLETAEAILIEAAEISPNDSDIALLRGKIYLNKNDPDQAIVSLRTVIKDYPGNVQAYILLNVAHIQKNERDQSQNVLQSAFENNRDNPEALLKLARYHAYRKQFEQAGTVMDEYMKLESNDYDGLSLYAEVSSYLGKDDQSADAAEKLRLLYPDKDNGYVLAIPSLIKARDYATSESVLAEGYKKTQSDRIYNMWTELRIASGKHKQVIGELNSSKLLYGNEAKSLLLARAYLKDGKMYQAIRVLEDSKNSDDDRVESYAMLASIYKSRKKYKEEEIILSEATLKYPDNNKLQYMYAELINAAGIEDRAIKHYEKILTLSPDNLIVINNLASLLAEGSAPEQKARALELVQILKDQDKASYLDTTGWVLYNNEKFDEAVVYLKKAAARARSSKDINYHLGMAYYRTGDKEGARTHLQRAVDDGISFNGYDEAKNTLSSL